MIGLRQSNALQYYGSHIDLHPAGDYGIFAYTVIAPSSTTERKWTAVRRERKTPARLSAISISEVISKVF